MKKSAKKCSRSNHNRFGSKIDSDIRSDSDDFPILIRQNTTYRCLFQIQIRRAFQDGLHPELIRLSIALNARCPNAGPLGPIQKPKLQSCSIRINPHLPAKGIDFSDEMTFGESAYSGIAGHLANRIQVLS